jgi:predicted GTPase
LGWGGNDVAAGLFVERAHEYVAWRSAIRQRVADHASWLDVNNLLDEFTRVRIERLFAHAETDRLTIAVVGEFSRGKSELINAFFAPGFGRRLLPALPGRSTMCPTELRWDPSRPPSLRLLKIETRATDTTLEDLKQQDAEWLALPLDPADAKQVADALAQVSRTRLAPLAEARRYDLAPATAGKVSSIAGDAMVEIPCWRHAIVNLPHPLLAQGLVILDTPGLNALGYEPELTLNVLPSAHVLIYVLSIDTGVSQSDLDAWRDYVVPCTARKNACFVALNKIDTLWDGIRTTEEIAHHVSRQVAQVSDALRIQANRVLPVSAQKGLVANVTEDEALLERSGIGALEEALLAELIPARHRITLETLRGEVRALIADTRASVRSRLEDVIAQLAELESSRGEKHGTSERLLQQVQREKVDFERGLAHLQTLRGVFADRSNALFNEIGLDALDAEARRALSGMAQSYFTTGMREAMRRYFGVVRARIEAAGAIVDDLHGIIGRMQEEYERDGGMELVPVREHSLHRFVREVDQIERIYVTRFDTLSTMLTHEQAPLTRRFFRTLATQIKRIFSVANHESTQWLRHGLRPLERQIRDRQALLREKLVAVKRIHADVGSLKSRVASLEQAQRELDRQLRHLQSILDETEREVLWRPWPPGQPAPAPAARTGEAARRATPPGPGGDRPDALRAS